MRRIHRSIVDIPSKTEDKPDIIIGPDFSLSVSTDRAAVDEPVTVTLNFPDERKTLPVGSGFRWYSPQGSSDCSMDTSSTGRTVTLTGSRKVNCSVHCQGIWAGGQLFQFQKSAPVTPIECGVRCGTKSVRVIKTYSFQMLTC